MNYTEQGARQNSGSAAAKKVSNALENNTITNVQENSPGAWPPWFPLPQETCRNNHFWKKKILQENRLKKLRYGLQKFMYCKQKVWTSFII